jgi:hypothetical protein
MRDLRKSGGDPDTYSFVTGLVLGSVVAGYQSQSNAHGIMASSLLRIVSTVLVWGLILDPLLRWWYKRKPVFRAIRFSKSAVRNGT